MGSRDFWDHKKFQLSFRAHEHEERALIIACGKVLEAGTTTRIKVFQVLEAGTKRKKKKFSPTVHFSGYGPDECQTNDVHVFDFGMYTWSKPVMKGMHPSPQDSHSSTAVGSKLYVFGGTDGTSPLDDLFVLDNATNTWGKPDVFGDVPALREGHSASLIGDNLFVIGGYTFVWKKISTTGVSPIPRDSHTCSSYKNCFVVMGDEDGGNPETMAWQRRVFGRLRIPLVPALLHVSPLQEIPWMQSEAYDSSMGDVTKSLKLWMTCISSTQMLREKDPSEPKLSMRKELKRRRQEYHATPFVLDKQRDADKSLVSSHGEFQAHVQLLGKKMFEARESDVFNYGYTLEASIDGKLFCGLLFLYKPGFAQAVQSYMARKENITGGNHRTSKRP
ncbi:hypothetical protein SELMODRAFT_432298 [Selaginella moellendorffii]|uniref:DCD domain-containing protein n=1 Tax=Selaginella moellendorffii TaxID=88036 RepID=D8TFK5_SELML|nr:hypothetical protein SELMODRAFT_432298 [Selaginella moellendorffii]